MGSVRDIAPGWLSFVRASEWGIIWKRPPEREGLADPETYIHHGAGGRMGNDHKQAMRTLQKWYHDSKNYSTIAYDVMVHRSLADGTVAILGAREGWLSAATADRNDLGEAICLFGYFHPGSSLSEQPTEREIEALAFAVAWSIEMGWSASNTKILGHRDNPAHPGASSCPGNYLYPHVPAIGRRAFEILAQANKPPTPTPPPTPVHIPWVPDLVPAAYYLQLGDITMIERRIYDSRYSDDGQPAGLYAIQTGIDPNTHSAVFCNITTIGGDTPGYMSTGHDTSFNNFGPGQIVDNARPFELQVDGTIHLGVSGSPAHVIVDLIGAYPR